MFDNPAERLWHRVVFPKDFDADYEERILAEARSIAHRRLGGRIILKDPADAKELLRLRLLGNPEELLACMFLDNWHRIIAFEILFRGSINECAIYPRVVARHALLHNASAVIMAHNHPSGVCEPSELDRRITHHLREALALLDVGLLDHFITGVDEVVSMAERGWV
jgi:DNA repair protein RadC